MNDLNNKIIDWSVPPRSTEIPVFLAPESKKTQLSENSQLLHFYTDIHPLVSFKIVFPNFSIQNYRNFFNIIKFVNRIQKCSIFLQKYLCLVL